MGPCICRLLKNEWSAAKGYLEYSVHSVFEHAINLTDESGRMITLLYDTPRMMPFSVRLGPKAKRPKLGQTVRCARGVIHCPEGMIGRTGDMELYDPQPELPDERITAEELRQRLGQLRGIILTEGSMQGAAPLVLGVPEPITPHQKYILSDYTEWARALRTQDIDALADASAAICGYGSGLTPYMDDVMCGAMLAGCYYRLYAGGEDCLGKNVSKAILSRLDGKTNSISMHMLRLSGDGLAASDLKMLMQAMLTPTKNRLYNCAKSTMDFGNSSGTDMLCGVYLSLSYNCASNPE